MKRRLATLWITAIAALVLLTGPTPALAQTNPVFRLTGWSTDPDTLQRGQEFDLKVHFTNEGDEAALDVTVTIGQGGTFVGLDTGEFYGNIGAGDDRTAKLRAAVSNSVTTGHYTIPIQISYIPDGGTIALTEVMSVGVYVEGLAPAGQDEGEPAFDIVDWSVQPETLQRGQEFSLTLTFQNVGTWDGNSVIVDIGQGQSFVGLQASDSISTIQINAQQTVTLRGAVSNTITTGHYDLPVEFSYHHAALGGQRQSSTETIGVYVEGIAPSTGPDYGRPQIVIDQSEVRPSDTPGRINLTLTLHNTGNRWARAVVVNLGQSDIFSPAEGSSAISLDGDIKVDERREVVLPLVLLKSPEGRFTQDFTIEYASYSGGSYQTTERVPVSLSGEIAQAPRLLVENYQVEPTPITPGTTFDLKLTLANVGAGAAEQIFVRLNELGPLAPVDTSNVRFVDELAAGQRLDLDYQLAAEGSTSDSQVAIQVEMTYEDPFGVESTETVTISLRIQAIPHFYIDLFEPLPDPILVGDTFELPVEVINIGENRVNVSTVSVTSDQLLIHQDGEIYIGPLDGGTSGTLVPLVEALAPGTVDALVTVRYLDSFQQPQSITETLTFDVAANPDETADGGGEGSSETSPDKLTFGQRVWRSILGLLGLGTRPADEANGVPAE